LNYWKYTNTNGHMALIRQIEAMNDAGVFKGVFVWVQLHGGRQEDPKSLSGIYTFKQDDWARDYAITKIQDPNDVLKDLL